MIICSIETKDYINLAFTGIVAFSTVVYACLTRKLVNETRAQRKVITEPKIYLSLQPHSNEKMNIFELILENVGPGIAYDLKFEFIKDYKYVNSKKLSELGFFKTGLKILALNIKYQTYVGSALENVKEKQNNPIEVKVQYRNSNKDVFEENFHLDFSELFGLLYLQEKNKTDLLIELINNLTETIKDIKVKNK